jgi:UDP-galactopyranose mutase
MKASYDFLIVGAGFSGLSFAVQASTQLKAKCLVVDSRPHIGGNAYDYYDEAGILIHAYGPHYFRTNSPKIQSFLSQFTDWTAVEYQIRSFSEGRYWNFPINLNTFEQLIGRPSDTAEMESWLEQKRVPIANPRNSEEVIISQVGWELYEKFFKNYTIKQWNKHPSELDASVCGRIPIRTNRDDRYLVESFQALPSEGYTKMFERMLVASGPHCDLQLNTDFRDVMERVEYGHLVYTGQIDAFFEYCYGDLPYRSLRFERESFAGEALDERLPISGKRGFWQPAVQVNYPNSEQFTRIVELKHATGQISNATTIVREYPKEFKRGGEPFYPIPNSESALVYKQYKNLADQCVKTSFIGRLATYRYYNMDQVVGMALAEFDRIRGTWRRE